MSVFRYCLGVIFCFVLSIQVANASTYIQAASNLNQIAAPRMPHVLTLGKVDKAQGIRLVNNTAVVTVSGTYYVALSVQVGADKNATDSGYIDLSGYLDVWLTHNGKPIPNTNTRQYINNGSTSVLLTQSVIELKANDMVGASYLSTNPSFGLIAIPATKLEPSVSSVLFSMFKLNE